MVALRCTVHCGGSHARPADLRSHRRRNGGARRRSRRRSRRKQQGLHTVAGWTYQICCAVLCTSALALVALQPALWGFAVIAVLTEAAAVGAVVVRRRRRPGWQPKHVRLVLSSYVSFLTGLVVQTAGGLWWVVPVVIGSTVVSVVTGRVAASSSVRQEQHRVAEFVP